MVNCCACFICSDESDDDNEIQLALKLSLETHSVENKESEERQDNMYVGVDLCNCICVTCWMVVASWSLFFVLCLAGHNYFLFLNFETHQD